MLDPTVIAFSFPVQFGEGLRVRSGEELCADPALAGDVEWLVDGLFPFGGLSIVYGLPKSGKTTLVMNCVAAILRGESFLGRATECCNVLWLDLEQHERLTRRKVEDEGALDGLAQVFAYNGAAPTLADVENTALRLNARFVVVDSLSSLLMLEDENDNAEITRRISAWRDLTHARNFAFIGVHHSRKSEGSFGVGMRGGNAILAISDVAMEVKRLHSESDEDDGRRKLVCVSRYDEANEMILVQRVDNEYVVEDGSAKQRAMILLGLLAHNRWDTKRIARQLHARRHTVAGLLRMLMREGKVQRFGSGAKGDPFLFGAS